MNFAVLHPLFLNFNHLYFFVAHWSVSRCWIIYQPLLQSGLSINPYCNLDYLSTLLQSGLSINPYCNLDYLSTLLQSWLSINPCCNLALIWIRQTSINPSFLSCSFMPVKSGSESDMRFVYCACCISYILDDWTAINTDAIVQFIKDSMVCVMIMAVLIDLFHEVLLTLEMSVCYQDPL